MAKGDGPIPDKNGKTIRRNENAQKPEGKGKGIHTFGPPPCSGRNRTGIAAVSHETDTGRRRKIAECLYPAPYAMPLVRFFLHGIFRYPFFRR